MKKITGELKCKDCNKWFEVSSEIFNRYMYEGDDYQCEKCFHEKRNRFYDSTMYIV
jgi:hypothetical protein